MGNFIGKVTCSNVTPKTLKQLILEAVDARFAGKTADEKARYLSNFNKWVSDETTLFPQGADITICDNYLAVMSNSVPGNVGTTATAADMGNFGTVFTDGTSKHIQKGTPLQNVLVISSVNSFALDIDAMIGEL